MLVNVFVSSEFTYWRNNNYLLKIKKKKLCLLLSNEFRQAKWNLNSFGIFIKLYIYMIQEILCYFYVTEESPYIEIVARLQCMFWKIC